MAETGKLAAILAADVVGFSRLAGVDEERTLARLRALALNPNLALWIPLRRPEDAARRAEGLRRAGLPE